VCALWLSTVSISDDRAAASDTKCSLEGRLQQYSGFLKISHVNAQSLGCHIDEFRNIFASGQCDVVLVCETWLKPFASSRGVDMEGYTLLRNDRLHKNGGGVAAYVRKELKPVLRLHSDTQRANKPEYLIVEITVLRSKALLAVCYRPPHIGFMDEFEDALTQCMANYRHIIVMGDFNTDLLGPTTSDKTQLTTIFRSCNLTLLSLGATHHTATSHTLLDLIAVSDPKLVRTHGQIPAPGLSGHDLIYCIYNIKSPKIKPKIIKYHDYKNVDSTALFQETVNIPWHEIYFTNNVNNMLNTILNNLQYLFSKYIPLKHRRITRTPAPWITQDIKQLMKERDRLCTAARRTHDPVTYAEYKVKRNRCKQLIRNSKSHYFKNLLRSQTSTASKWRTLKTLGAGKDKSKMQVRHTVEELNRYFSQVPVSLDLAIEYSRSYEVTPFDDEFYFAAVPQIDVIKSISEIKSNAVGADALPLRFIKMILPLITPYITHLYNTSFMTSIFPSAFKFSLIIPINKIPSPVSPSDYRPVSILSVLSKGLERLAHEQMSSFVTRKGLLGEHQSGFRGGHSTTSALICVSDDIRSAMDKRQATLMVLIDLSKAFDCIYHPLLLKKLRNYGFSDSGVAWVRSYLFDRQQSVRADKVSGWRVVNRGVPQGSVLGPLLFSLYVNDITDRLLHSRYHLYADDIQVYRHFKIDNFEAAVTQMNEDLAAISFWTRQHGLIINETKSKSIVIGNSRLLNQLDLDNGPFVEINLHRLEYCDNVTNLGLTFNKHLDWTEHVTKTCNRIYAGIHSLKTIGAVVPFNERVMLVKTLIFPHFFYGDVVIQDMTVALSERLQRAQNYCVRFVFGLDRDAHISPYYTQMGMLRLRDTRTHHVLMLLHKILSTKVPEYLSVKFQFLGDLNGRDTRHGASLLNIPIHRTVTYNRSFCVTACRLWNSLPAAVRIVKRRASFGAAVLAWLREGDRSIR
jgi:hypothetical protein